VAYAGKAKPFRKTGRQSREPEETITVA